MIAKLRGRLDSTGEAQGENWAVVDAGGVGYLLFCAAKTLAALPPIGEIVELAVETHVREDHIHLYGFTSTADRQVFRTLTTVQGVGAKVGLAILSALSGTEVAQAIAAGDRTAFTRASGVGPKLAARLVTELKDKLGALAFSAPGPIPSTQQGSKAAGGRVREDAVSALVNLGYGRMEAFGAVARVVQTAGEAATLKDVIKTSLRELGAPIG